MIVSGGNFHTELDELELGERVAVALDSEAVWGAATTYWWMTQDYSQIELKNPWEEDWYEGLG